MFVITASLGSLIGCAILLLYIVLFVIPSAIRSGFEKFKRWRKTGYCKHEFKLYSTHSVGNYADFKCSKCGEDRILRL